MSSMIVSGGDYAHVDENKITGGYRVVVPFKPEYGEACFDDLSDAVEHADKLTEQLQAEYIKEKIEEAQWLRVYIPGEGLKGDRQ